MEKLLLTISREFGSGGRLVGERLAKELDISFYDHALIHLAVAKSGLDPATIEKAEEEATSKFLFHLAIGGYVSSGVFSQINVPITDQVFFAQSKVIEEAAAKESCVIVGRCANYILRNHPGLVRIFIYGTEQDRLKRITGDYGVPESEAKARLTKMDKARTNYYEYYTGETWGAVHSYDLAINTAFTGIDGAVRVIRSLLGR